MICLNRRYFFGVLLIFFAVDLATQLGAAQTSGPLVLQGGTLIDATGRPPIEDAVIVVEGNSIKSVGKRGDVAIPRKARVIDVKGKTVLPGLIDGHCHLLDFVGEIYLHLGITTCPDITQNDDEWTLAERQGTNLGKIRGPRIWSTGSRLVGPPLAWALRGERLFDQDAGRVRFQERSKPRCGGDRISLSALHYRSDSAAAPSKNRRDRARHADVSVVTSLSPRDQSRRVNRRHGRAGA